MMTTKTSKKGKRGNKNVDHQEDRLSNLPNELLIKILSCLKTREAIISGILSTRWKSVWASVPVLDVYQSDFNFKGKRSDGDHKREEARFLNFVDQVLIARKMPRLEKVHISGERCDFYLLRSWMRAALKRNANELNVDFVEVSDNFPRELAHNFFSHNKLVSLKLCVDMTVNFLPYSSGFPNLKFLQLDRIIYQDDESLPNLLSICPILEDLVITIGGDNYLGTLNLISSSVKRLKLGSESDIWGDPAFVNKVVFDAPVVESLDIDGLRTHEFVVKDLSRLVDAKFEILDLRYFSDTYKVLRDVSNVKYLSLDERIVQSIERSDDYDFPMFNNLTRLEIYGDNCCEENDDWPEDERAKILQWELLLEILKCSPMLEHLIYKYDGYDDAYGTSSDWEVPDCLVSSLKTVEFTRCLESDVERLKYFLLNAKVLETMTIREISSAIEDLKLKLCSAIFENKKGVAVTWSEMEIVISFH